LKKLILASLLLAALGQPFGAGAAAAGSPATNVYAERLADAIYIAEGGAKAKWPYGVLRVKDPKKARRICLQIIETESQVYDRLLEQRFVELSFIDFLALRYCPPHAHPLNSSWPKNVKFWFRKLSPP